MAILDSVGLTVPTARITDGAYDERGARYLVPQYCLSAPDNLLVSGKQHGVIKRGSVDSGQSMDIRTAVGISSAVDLDPDPDPGIAGCSSSVASSGKLGMASPSMSPSAHRLVVRMSSTTDVCLFVNRAATVAQIETQLRSAGHVAGDPGDTLRFAYMGRILEPTATPIQDFDMRPSHVLQVWRVRRGKQR
ncbi:hypothetical protein LPJ57_002459 [Coemansia sp. RSA 486]|nr:hypothetical protein LPJ57_002459 [Coemansia sp. RSA 486]